VEVSFSQTDYRRGYVITNTRDTLNGLVDYREGVKAHRSCDFKNSKAQPVISYEPASILGYGFQNDKFFLSKEILIKDQQAKVVFLEVLVLGLVSLYKFEDTYFIEKDTSGLLQLINESKEITVDGKKLSKNTNQHIGTINMLLFDCAELKSKIEGVKLHEKALTSLIEDYNRCKGALSIAFKAKKPWTKAGIGLTGGVNISQLSFDTAPGFEHLSGDFEISTSPTFGVSFEVKSPRLSERISFHGNLLYLISKYYNYNLFNYGSSTEINYVTIELQQLKIPVGICYTFPKRNFTPYFVLGISSTLHLGFNTNWIQEVESFNMVVTHSNEALAIKKSQFGVWGGCGLLRPISSKLNAFVEFRYEQTNGIAQNSVDPLAHFQSKIINFQLSIGINRK
jgi:hypothetical protein